jgi:hypothetical protein
MASPERMLMFCHILLSPSVGQPSNKDKTLQNEKGIACLTTIVNKRQMTISYGGRIHKRHSLQAGILKNCIKGIYITVQLY